MKKTWKAFAALALAGVMTMSMSFTAFATEAGTESNVAETTKKGEGNFTVTVNNDTTDTSTAHDYKAYQIFKGDLTVEGENKTLTHIEFGDGVNGTALITALTADGAPLAGQTIADAAALAEAIGKLNATNDDATAQALAQIIGANLTTATGTGSATGVRGLTAGYYLIQDEGNLIDKPAAKTRFILQVCSDATVTQKASVPTVEKKVKENVKEVNTAGTDTDTRISDYNIPARYNDVADYNIGDTVPFQIIGTLPSTYDDYTTYHYEFYDTTSDGLAIDEDSVKVTVNGKNITDAFTVTLNGNSLTVICDNLKAITDVTKASKIVVDYNATLDSDAVIGLDGNPNEVYLKFSNNPNKNHDGDKGQTPEDKVVVFTYELDVTKIDGEDEKKLEGAEFVLKNSEGKFVTVNSANKVTGWVATEAEATKLVSGSDGLFKVIGLDDGTYKLKETKAPTNYNLLKDEIELVIGATTVNGQTYSGTASEALTALKIKVDGKEEDGDDNHAIVTMNVKNNKGATLPSTGGIGTTIFYIVGTVLVIGAGVLLVTRRRMSAQ